ncbi:hypothetical protein Ddc_13702 [Ditylenchus destructor]|nr:hypothetical protein Ddc_13702 [Ditylenchus destructor]
MRDTQTGPLPHSVRASIDFIDSRGALHDNPSNTLSLFWVWWRDASLMCRVSIGRGEFRNPANLVRKCSSCRQKRVVLGQLFSLAPEIGLVLPFIPGLTTKILLLTIELTKIHSLSSPLSLIDHHRFAAQRRISRNYRTNKSRDPVFHLRVISDSNINVWCRSLEIDPRENLRCQTHSFALFEQPYYSGRIVCYWAKSLASLAQTFSPSNSFIYSGSGGGSLVLSSECLGLASAKKNSFAMD